MGNNSGREENIVENHRFIEMEDADELLAACIVREMKPMPSSRCCIYKVPKRLRRVKKAAFVPEIVSIGPFHYGKESLKAMEEHKKWYLHAIMSRTSTSLEDLVKAIRALEDDARDCYAEPINLNSDEFVKMMIFDSCFILELLYISAEEVPSNETDPICNSRWMVDSLIHDVILLENQVPFFVVESLFNLTRDPEEGGYSLAELVKIFLRCINPRIRDVGRNSRMKGKHLLDILHNNLLPSFTLMEVGYYPISEFRHCATDLEQAGVNFKKNARADSQLDIKFSKKGVFEIPPFPFNTVMEDVLRNLIAWEQCDKYNSGQITSYVLLLDILINTQKDVKLLRQKGILENLSIDDEMIAIAINKLCDGVEVKTFHYDVLCNRVNAYYQIDRNRWGPILKREHCNTPCAILSIIAATVLLLLTIIQTIFSILP